MNIIKRSVDYTKKEFTKEEKEIIRKEVDLVKAKYPSNIPIVVRTNDIRILKSKFLVSGEITMGQFLYIIRKKLDKCVSSTKSLFIFVNNNTLVPASELLSSVYDRHKDAECDMLFMTLCSENTFG